MNEIEKKGIGKAGVGLLVLTVLAVILIVSNVLVYVSLQRKIDSLEIDNNDLNIQVNTLQSEVADLEKEISDLEWEISNLQQTAEEKTDSISIMPLRQNKDLVFMISMNTWTDGSGLKGLMSRAFLIAVR